MAAHARAQLPDCRQYPEGQNVWLNAKDPEGNFLGGFRSEIFFHWLFVNILFVEEAHRNKGVGDWQAPAFYLKHGYRELLRWPDYYQGHASSLMVKDL